MTNQSSLFYSKYQISVLKNTHAKIWGVEGAGKRHLFFLLRRKSLIQSTDGLEAMNVSPTGKQRMTTAPGPR